MISGLQKLTLLDYPGHVACTVFTGGCNLRCPFCHNASLVLPDRERGALDPGDLLAFLKKRTGVLDGVAVTGGEPLLGDDIFAFLYQLRELGYAIKLDTNGFFPQRLHRVLEEKLADYVAIDIKASPQNYPTVTGRPGLDLAPLNESIALLRSCRIDYEFRTTYVKGLHTAADPEAIGEWLAGARRYFLQSYKNSGDVIAENGLTAFSPQELKGFLAIVTPYIPAAQLRGVD